MTTGIDGKVVLPGCNVLLLPLPAEHIVSIGVKQPGDGKLIWISLESKPLYIPGRSLSFCLKQMMYISNPLNFSISLDLKNTVNFPDSSSATASLAVVLPQISVVPPTPRSIRM